MTGVRFRTRLNQFGPRYESLETVCAIAIGLHWMDIRGLVLLWTAKLVVVLDETSQHGTVAPGMEVKYIFTGGTISQILGTAKARAAQSEGKASDIIVRKRSVRDRN